MKSVRAFLIAAVVSVFLYGAAFGASMETINLGTTPNDGTGDSIRAAFGKVNRNFEKAIPPEVDALNEYGSGTSYTSTTIDAAKTAIGSGTANILIRPGAWAITSPVVFTDKIQPIMPAGAYFVISGSGSVTGLKESRPEWFGAVVGGSIDCGDAINNAIISVSSSVGSGYRAGIVIFQSGVYLTKKTITFLPFINYIGVRGSVANAGATYTDVTDSHGTVIRGHADIYTNDNSSGGVIIYVPTGDISIDGIIVVGTNSINANPSVGIQWGNSGTSRTHELGTTQNVSGIVIGYVTFYACIQAWEIYSLNDMRGYSNRFEVNNTAIALFGRASGANGGTSQMELYGAELYANLNGIAFGTATTTFDVKMIGGAFEGSQGGTGEKSIVTSATLPTKITFKAIGTTFRHFQDNVHIYLVADWTGATTLFEFDDCLFVNETSLDTLGIYLTKSAGSAAGYGVYFNNCTLANARVVTDTFSKIFFNGGVFKNSLISSSTTWSVGVKGVHFTEGSGATATAITLVNAGCYDWGILENTFDSTITTPVSVFSHPANIDLLIENNRGLKAIKAVADGATSIDTRGASNHFITGNTGATVLSAITGAYDGQRIFVLFGDAVTTVDFTGTNLHGNASVDYAAALSDSMICTYVKGTDAWYCTIQKGS